MAKATDKFAVLLKLKENKACIQDAITEKRTTVVQLAADFKMPPSTFKQMLDTVGIELPRRQYKPEEKHCTPLMSDFLVVLARVCRELDIPHDEIKGYLPS